MPDQADQRDYSVLALMFMVSGELVVPILIGVYLDSVTGWGPWLAIAGAVLGFIAVTTHTLSAGRRMGGGRPPASGADQS